MAHVSRRQFVAGLAALGAGGLVLRADAGPTPASGEVAEYERLLRARPAPAVPALGKLGPTEDCILGPYYRAGAPFRGKVTPPLEPGVVLLVSGRVWGYDTRRPLAGACLDVWQANARGRYDNDDPDHPPRNDVFVNRCRLITDETGFYQFETVHPGPYKIGPESWRPSHIHYAITHPGYQTLVTQLFFKGDPHNATDEFIKESLIIETRTQKVGPSAYEAGTFDIALVRQARGE
jgi:catechol 1,2-dioxygenase